MTPPHQHHPENDLEEALASGVSDHFLGHALTPANVGMLPDPDGHAAPGRECGDYLELFLRVKDGVIADARFFSEGCLFTMASGSALTTILKGKTVQEAARLTARDVAGELGSMPEAHFHTAELAHRALREALEDYRAKQTQPWRRPYSKV